MVSFWYIKRTQTRGGIAIYVGRDPSLMKHIQNTKPTHNGTRERVGIAIYVGRDPSLIKHIQNTKPTNNGTRERGGTDRGWIASKIVPSRDQKWGF